MSPRSLMHRLQPSVIVLAIAASLAASDAAAAESQTINAFATWQGRGEIFVTGPGTGTFMGSIGGPLFIETEKGPASAGQIVCPAMLEIDLSTAVQSGQGKCTVTTDDGAKVFATWTCRGVHLVGCDGEIVLTGGSGRMAGITGSGEVRVRTTTRAIAASAAASGSAGELGSGILVLRNLTYALPAQ